MVIRSHSPVVDGLPIHFLIAGKGGPPVVLLPGVNALDWRWVMPALAANNRVQAPDLPGSSDIPECGHLPHVECPEPFLEVLDGVVGSGVWVEGGPAREQAGTMNQRMRGA